MELGLRPGTVEADYVRVLRVILCIPLGQCWYVIGMINSSLESSDYSCQIINLALKVKSVKSAFLELSLKLYSIGFLRLLQRIKLLLKISRRGRI